MTLFKTSKPSRRLVLGAGALALAAPALWRGARPAEAAAARLGPSAPLHRRFALGSFEVTTISDAAAMIDGPWPIVGEDRPAADVARLMAENLLPEARFQPGFTPTIVNTGRELVLFDAGNGEVGFVPQPNGGRMAESLASAGIQASDIDVVVLTHAHTDHIGGLLDKGAPFFPNARYAIGAKEHAFWSEETRVSAPRSDNEAKSAAVFRTHLLPFAGKTAFIGPEDEVVPGIRAVAAFGHTPGHLAFHVESEGKRLLIWGDAAHHEVASLARPEWHALFDMDKEQGAATRKRIYDMAATDRIPVVGYHATFPSVGYVETRGPGSYRWIAHSYQLDG